MDLNPEFPDLDPPTPNERRVHEVSNQLYGLSAVFVMSSWALLYASFALGVSFLISVPHFVGANGGLLLMFLGWRNDRRELVTRGTWCMAADLALVLVAVALTK
ncbi:hypothetical protein QOM21_25160 [Streptomyces sp. Pv4-95]|uniref:hypothetical protein n=1 Tax=Streptomyces sp. Pv4-95 TaxID=3049543 RepID=UPI00389143DA